MQYLPMPLREGQGIPPIPKSQKKPTHFIHPKKKKLSFASEARNGITHMNKPPLLPLKAASRNAK